MQPAPPGASTCPNCGRVLEETPSGGLGCTFCLLQAGIGGEEETVYESTPDAVKDGVRFGVYEIDCHPDGSLYELGRGAMGVTYRATDTTLQRKVALKIIKTDIAQRSADARERFMREARAAAALRHENIAVIHQFGMRLETGQYFYAMELIEGETLDERVRRAGPLDASTTIGIAQQVTSALAAAEKHHLVHRDLKPANLMLVSPDDETADFKSNKKVMVKIIDFGLAKAIHTQTDPKSLTHERFVGTPAFASPEQFEHSPIDVRSDIYSLGETLWFALTGKAPFAGHSVEEIHRAQKSNVLPVEQLKAAHVPSRLTSLLKSMLALEPASRPSTHELAAGLQHCSPEARRARRTHAALAIAALVIFGMSALYLFQPLRMQNAPSNPAPEKSIAVLPFENLSDDPDNAYFADGIQAEILTRLVSIADLKVISRTSTQRYHSRPGNLPEIAKQLGVANVLEGSVQKAGDQVRVNVQMVNAQTDSHLWAQTFDRKLTDIFGVESEIAKGIAESLQAKLTGQEEQALAVKPTNNPEAYDAYLRGLGFDARSAASFTSFSPDLLAKAADSYERAVGLDSNFAFAWARLSRANAGLYFNYQATRGDAAKTALENAQRLAPDSPETLLALGYYQFWVLRDYGLAKTTFGRVRKMLPASSEVLGALGTLIRREGNWDQSIAYFEQALALDPRNVELLMRAALTYSMVRQFPAALKLYDRVLDITPNDPDVMATKAAIYQAQGNLQEAARLLSGINAQTPSESSFQIKITQLQLERNYDESVRVLQTRQAQFHVTSQDESIRTELALAFMQHLAGDMASAKVTAEQVRDTLEQLCKEQPDDADLTAWLSQAYAVLGQKDLALQLAERAITRAKDALEGPTLEGNLALIQTMFGENSHAISILSQLLQRPYKSLVWGQTCITPALLRLDPLWDPLRSDPRFQELCKDKEPLLSAPTQIPEKSIAVLPFENLSEEKANAYFAQGIQNEILTRLATVRDLKVISRTSTAKYQSKPDNLRTIAQELGVSTILEGAVQKAGDKVRVNVQLIDAHTDAHLWAKSYDRDFKDVLSVESEVAEQIAEALKANLSPGESHVLAAARTQNAEAYDLFLRGEYEFRQAASGLVDLDAYNRADAFYRQALSRDPNFAEAAGELARSRLSRHWNVSPLAPAELEETKSLIDRAMALAPNSSEVHFALGLFFYWGHRQYDMALTEFNRTLELQPNNALARQYRASVYRRRGEWERSLADFQRTEQLDPRDAFVAEGIGSTYLALRLWKDAERAELRALAIDPHNALAALDLLSTRLNATGDVASARRAFDGFPEGINFIDSVVDRGDVARSIDARVYLDVMERRFTDAFQALENKVANNDLDRFQQLAGLVAVRVLAGELEAAKSVGKEALPLLEAGLRERPDDTSVMTGLSWVYLALGRNADALRVSRQLANTISIEKDSFAGPNFQNGLAQIEARAGAPEEAIKRLRRLLSIPAGQVASIARLKIDPVWDPIRNRPDFQELLSGPEQIGPNKK
jgi:TolB-like protein/Tfp pilus assembly protein PilF